MTKITSSYVTHGGYRFLRVDGEWIYEHRYVMEQRLGRKLASHEVVHHLDHDRLNNDPSNLAGPYTTTEHAKIHGLGGDWGQANKTHCDYGHPFDEANTYRWGPHGRYRTCRSCRARRQREYMARKRAMA